MVALPIWTMVGDNDSKPRVEGVPAMEKALKESGSTKVKISVLEGSNSRDRKPDEPRRAGRV